MDQMWIVLNVGCVVLPLWANYLGLTCCELLVPCWHYRKGGFSGNVLSSLIIQVLVATKNVAK